MRIILADNKKDVRSGLKMLLEQEPGLNVIGEAKDLVSLLSQAREKCPDVVLLDWELSSLKVSDGIPVLRTLCPHLKIIALSARPESARSAMAAGAAAFVSKGDYPEKLLEAIRNLAT